MVVRIACLVCLLSSFAVAQVPAKDRMVVVISLDGFPAYALEDPKTPVPTLRKLAAQGTSARMTTVNPTVTWPNHTAMVTGVDASRHGLLVNGTLVATNAWPPVKVEPKIAKEKMVHVPTVYDAAHHAGLTTAQVDWVAIENAATITWPFAEWASPEGRVEQEMIRKGAIAESDVRDFTKQNILWRDQVWTNAATYLIREHKPNLLLVHFLSLDSTHHSYGPKTLAAEDAMAFLDSCVAKIVAAVRDAGMEQKTTFLVVADHGFKGYTKTVNPAVAFNKAGLSGKVHVIPEGGSALVYLRDASVLSEALKALEGIEGLDKVVQPRDYAQYGLPTPGEDPQMSQLFLTAKSGYSFSGATGGPVTAEVPQLRGSHGYVSTDPEMDAIFIASGYGVRPGAKLTTVSNRSVAFTIANLLGVSLPTAQMPAIPLQ